MKSIKKIIHINLLLFITASALWGQTNARSISGKNLIQIKNDSSYYNFPLIRDTTGLYPDHLHVIGEVVDITIGRSCGISCGCGTIKVKLRTPLSNYNNPYVYIAIACFNVKSEDCLHKTIKIDVKLLSIYNKDCFWSEAITNHINSKGLPFYIPANGDKKYLIE